MVKALSILFLSVCIALQAIAQEIPFTEVPEWVEQKDFETLEVEEGIGDIRYNLIQVETNIIEKLKFKRLAYQLLNLDALESSSTIQLNFDPAFEQLEIHSVDLIRDGVRTDKTNNVSVEVLKREENLESNLYDGSLTVIIRLEDVKVGDVIDYSYSRKGFNPIFGANFSAVYDLEFSNQVDHYFLKIIKDKGTKLNIQRLNGAIEPEVKSGDFEELIWSKKNIEPVLYEVNTPNWYYQHKFIRLSTINNWSEYIDWASKLYRYTTNVSTMALEISDKEGKEERLNDYIRFVQDKVRYLGLESGIGAYKPNPPEKVYKQLYGDCKDKSLLLISLLRHEGLEAYPILVNTNSGEILSSSLPLNQSFNHCVVGFNYDNTDFVVDPTISFQGGQLSNRHQPNFHYGLAISDRFDELIEIDEKNFGKLSIKEDIKMDSVGGNAFFSVESEYTGSVADNIREYFLTSSKSDIEDSYLNYYSSIYPSIELVKDIEFNDDYESNRVIIKEDYYLPEFWEYNEEEGYYSCYSYPLVLDSYLDFPKSAKREMPYALGNKINFEQETTVHLPQEWEFMEFNDTYSDSVFTYTSIAKRISDDKLSLVHQFQLHKPHVSASDYDQFQSKIADIKGDLTYSFTHTGEDVDDFSRTDFAPSLFILVLIGLWVWLARKLYISYNPLSRANSSFSYDSIGGWMILPLIGLFISPLRMLYDIYDIGYLNAATWNYVYSSGGSIGFFLFFIVECLLNIGFLVFSILLLTLFFKRRTSLPNLFSIYLITNFVFLLLDAFISSEIYEIPMEKTETKALVRMFIGACIWVPYFQFSERVKDTFVNLHGSIPEEGKQLIEEAGDEDKSEVKDVLP